MALGGGEGRVVDGGVGGVRGFDHLGDGLVAGEGRGGEQGGAQEGGGDLVLKFHLCFIHLVSGGTGT